MAIARATVTGPRGRMVAPAVGLHRLMPVVIRLVSATPSQRQICGSRIWKPRTRCSSRSTDWVRSSPWVVRRLPAVRVSRKFQCELTNPTTRPTLPMTVNTGNAISTIHRGAMPSVSSRAWANAS